MNARESGDKGGEESVCTVFESSDTTSTKLFLFRASQKGVFGNSVWAGEEICVKMGDSPGSSDTCSGNFLMAH